MTIIGCTHCIQTIPHGWTTETLSAQRCGPDQLRCILKQETFYSHSTSSSSACICPNNDFKAWPRQSSFFILILSGVECPWRRGKGGGGGIIESWGPDYRWLCCLRSIILYLSQCQFCQVLEPIAHQPSYSFIYRRPTLYPLEIAVDFFKSP